MLILYREVGETLVIGENGDITITVLNMIKGNRARFGINAPKEVSVHRAEIYQRIQSKKQNPSNDKDQKDEKRRK